MTAAFVYFAIVFGAGFALGAVRVLFVVPRTGEIAAVLLETPLMLTISWIACGFVLARYAVPGDAATRLRMGGAAFALVVLAELAMAIFAFGRPVRDAFDAFVEPANLPGLAAQILFAFFPLLRRRGG